MKKQSDTSGHGGMANPVDVFRDYLVTKRHRQSRQRFDILDAFLRSEEHQTVDELFASAKKRNPSVGCATVYRTLRLLCECGLARELRFDDGPSRYEHLYGHAHHDHLVCNTCGRLIEVFDPDIERLQERLSLANGFIPFRHRMEIYGLCGECAVKTKKAGNRQ